MPSDMRPLGDYVSLLSGNTPSKGNPAYWGGSTPWVSAKDMGDFWIDDAEDHLTVEGGAVASRLVPAGTVLMLTRGMTLHKRVPICRVARPSTFNQDVKAVLPKEGISARFLPYLLVGNHDRLHERVDSAGHGTGRLNTDAILSFPVYVPDRREQEQIADIGEALDDRLRLLRETNATLEAIAQALFKSWFVDFDPVRAKAEGRDPIGMPPEVADLFPSEFEESELGEIPKGWRVGTFADITDVRGGATPSTKEPAYWEDGRHCWATPKDLSGMDTPVLLDTERKITDAGLAKISSGLLPVGTVLMSSRAPIGYLAIAEVPVAVNQGFIAMKPKAGISNLFLLNLLRVQMDEIKSHANGSTFMEISKAAFRPLKVVVPPNPVIQAFDDLARSLYERMVGNVRQIASLTELRDTLLPRLISGKLRLPEALNQLEVTQL